MSDTTHIEEALEAARKSLALAERRRPSTVAGPAASQARLAAQVERKRAAVERLERQLTEARLASIGRTAEALGLDLESTDDKEENVNASTITIGSRVRRVRGTSIEGLDGTVRLINSTGVLVALDHPEPGIGHQFLAPRGDLELLENLSPEGTTIDTAKGFSGRPGHKLARDFAATTHLEDYAAYEAHRNVSGFSGHGYALIDTASGEVIAEHAWRVEALAAQERVEAERAS